MEDRIISEDWQLLLRMFPSNWRELAKDTNAVTRKLRNFKDEEAIMRLFFLHFAGGYSLRETVTRATISGIADVSDVALLKRLRCSEGWLQALCISLLRERGTLLEKAVDPSPICLRLVDGTIVKEPGKTGSQWRIHYSLRLLDLQCDYFKLTEATGQNNGESFKQFPVKKGDCIVGDRGYSTLQGIEYLKQNEAYSLVRINSSTVKFYDNDENSFNLLAAVSDLKQAYEVREWGVKLKNDHGDFLGGRLCVVRKSQLSEEIAIKKIIKEASKRQRIVKPATLEYAKYVIIFTTLPTDQFNLTTILEWYRLRWQIELAFKRLKSLLSLGHLPKYDEQSSRAWLYGKLLVGLMVEKLMSYAGSISPCGYCL
jgi:hypothetical protein